MISTIVLLIIRAFVAEGKPAFPASLNLVLSNMATAGSSAPPSFVANVNNVTYIGTFYGNASSAQHCTYFGNQQTSFCAGLPSNLLSLCTQGFKE